MDEQLILDTAEAAAPALRALATEILQAEAAHLGVSLDAADVLLRRAAGVPALHVAAAADQLLEHLAAIEGTTLPGRGIVAVLVRAGAQLLVTGIELDGAYDAAERPRGERGRFGDRPQCRVAGIVYPELVTRAAVTIWSALAGGSAGVGGDEFAGLAGAGSGGNCPVSPGVRPGPVNPLPGGTVTADRARA